MKKTRKAEFTYHMGDKKAEKFEKELKLLVKRYGFEITKSYNIKFVVVSPKTKKTQT